jgi:hypothetical protein
MEYEKVIDKVKKLQALAERGERGEALAAKRALEALCSQHGIDIEELFSEEKLRCYFKLPYHDPFAKSILFQIYANVTGNKQITYREGKYKNEIWFELTNAQNLEIISMYSFFINQWKKEKKRLLENLIDAFINKHDLFSHAKDEEEKQDEPMTPERWKKIMEMSALMDTLEDVSYHKQIE